MPPKPDALTLESLLEHDEWVRRVARAVTRNEDDADEVRARAWLATAEADAAPERPRSWLGTVTRNAAAKLYRGRSRRTSYERLTRGPTAAPSPHELAERAELQALVTRELLALGEAERDALLLRYFDELPVAEVAVRLGVPLETARARLRRGRARLRDRLERRLGHDWRGVLVPLVGLTGSPELGAPAAGSSSATMGVVTMATSHWIAAGTVAALALGIAAWSLSGPPEPPTTPTASVTEDEPTTQPERPARTPREVVRTDEPGVSTTPEPASTAADPLEETAPPTPSLEERMRGTRIGIQAEAANLMEILGQVAAAADLPIWVAQEAIDATADNPVTLQFESLDAFSVLTTVSSILRVQVELEDERVVVLPLGGARDEALPLIQVPRSTGPTSLTVRGIVRGADGAPLADASVVQVAEVEVRVVGTTDKDGRFEVQLQKSFGALAAWTPGHAFGLARVIEGEYGDTKDVVLDAGAAGGTIEITVAFDGLAEDEDHRPVQLTVLPQTPDTGAVADGWKRVSRVSQWLSADRASATFEGVAEGRVVLHARVPGYAPLQEELVVVAGDVVRRTLRFEALPSFEEQLRQKRTTYRFTESNLREICNFWSHTTGIPIVVHPTAMELVDQDALTLDADREPLTESLDRLTQQIPGLVWEVLQDRMILLRGPKEGE